ncbi:MAG: hydrogenase small subunit [Syntrophothermaceae bacterium]
MDVNEYQKICQDPQHGGRLGSVVLPLLKAHFQTSKKAKPTVIWIETTGCSGNSVSLWNSIGPDLAQILEWLIDIRYWNFLMSAQDDTAIDILHRTALQQQNRFILVVEGAIALNEEFTVVHRQEGRAVSGADIVRELGELARHVLAVGTCAAFGGPSAARPNPSRSVGVGDFLGRKVVNASGCPAHPDWIIGTLGHLLLFGEPELEEFNRPLLFYGETVHRRCTRRSFFDRGIFAQNIGDTECMFLLGCKGPVTRADCPVRQWNDYVSWPVKANTPCIGCTNPGFPDAMEPFFEPLPREQTDAKTEPRSGLWKILAGTLTKRRRADDAKD